MILLSVGEISYTIAVGLSIGCPRLVGRRIAINSNMQEFFCTTLYNVHIRCNGKKGPAQDKPTRGDESLGPHKYMDGRLVSSHAGERNAILERPLSLSPEAAEDNVGIT